MPSHFVYVVTCADGTLYTGYALDVTKRLKTHNAGRGAKYTRARLPVTLLAAWGYESKREALQAEHRFKQLPRKAKLEYIHEGSQAP